MNYQLSWSMETLSVGVPDDETQKTDYIRRSLCWNV